jgi:cytochrome c peroxidase
VTLEIEVRPTFESSPLLLDSLRYQTAAAETLSFTRLSCLLSGFALEREDGVWLELPDQYAWLDAEKRRNVVRLEGVPAGAYRALRFHIGPDAKANASDPAKFPAAHALNPNLNGLHWSWQGGYIFLAVEGHYRAPASELKGYAYHLARDPNRTRISLTASLDLAHDAAVALDFDLAVLFNVPRPLSCDRDGAATHSRDGDPVAAKLVANLPGAFRVTHVLSAASVVTRAAPVTPLYLPEKFTPYRFTMSSTFPIPDLPRDNPLTDERVALGKALFHEPALSRDGTLSCASCHVSTSAFADPRRFSLGVGNQSGRRNAMPLQNLAWKSSFFWDGRAPSLRAQALMPIQDHTEMAESLTNVVAKLSATGRASVLASPNMSGKAQGSALAGTVASPANNYPSLFTAAFGAPEISAEKIGLALEQFVLTLTAFDSKFDRAMQGKATLSTNEQRGFELFMTEYEPRTGQLGADCFHCHGGADFSTHAFANNGLDAVLKDTGRYEVTKKDADRGKFAVPSLRNVALTAPYMHDGRFQTLEEVVVHYSSGVKRTDTLDPNLAKHPAGGLNFSAADKAALVAFLRTLTEERYAGAPPPRSKAGPAISVPSTPSGRHVVAAAPPGAVSR